MSALRPLAATMVTLALLAGTAISQEAARPPQPPLTNTTLKEWGEELGAISRLLDNEFLYEEASLDFSRRVVHWEGSPAMLNLQVERVTKEAVICESLGTGDVTIQNEQEPVSPRRQEFSRAVAIGLRIGDVIPLDVARRLRQGDQVVVRGVVVASDFQSGRPLRLAIAKSRAVAVVSRSYVSDTTGVTAIARARSSRIANYEELVATPPYPADALAAGAAGNAVVTVVEERMSLAKSAGNPLLDEAVMQAMRPLGRNTRLFQGEHQFTFTILQR